MGETDRRIIGGYQASGVSTIDGLQPTPRLGDIGVDRVSGDAQFAGDLLALLIAGDEPQDLLLTRRQGPDSLGLLWR